MNLTERARQALQIASDAVVERVDGRGLSSPSLTVRGQQMLTSAPGQGTIDGEMDAGLNASDGKQHFILGIDTFDDGTKYF